LGISVGAFTQRNRRVLIPRAEVTGDRLTASCLDQYAFRHNHGKDLESAGDFAQGHLNETENDFAWETLRQIEYQIERTRDRLTKPELSGDFDEEIKELLEP
jgi:hypothetical protein